MIAWERQDGESLKSYEAFSAYRDLGVSRSIESAWKQYSQSSKRVPGYFGAWAADNNWVVRAASYDDYIDKEARKKIEADAIKRKAKMLERHAASGRVLQGKGLEYLQAHGVDRGTDAIRAIVKGVDVERKAEGLPEWIFEVVDADDTELTRQYNAILAEIGGYRGGDETARNDPTGQDPTSETDSPEAE